MHTDLNTKDLRVRRTHKLLVDSLYHLLQTKPFSEISVIDICDHAMVHRTTFYRHFEDKYQLLDYAFSELFDLFQKEIAKHHSFVTLKEYYLHILDFLLAFLDENPSIVHLLKATDKNTDLLDSFHEFLVADVIQKVELHMGKGKVPPLELTMITEYHIGAIMNLCKWRAFNNMPISREAFMHYVSRLITNEFYPPNAAGDVEMNIHDANIRS